MRLLKIGNTVDSTFLAKREAVEKIGLFHWLGLQQRIPRTSAVQERWDMVIGGCQVVPHQKIALFHQLVHDAQVGEPNWKIHDLRVDASV